MFFEPFIVLRNNQCSAELTIGFDSRYFVPILHLLRSCVKTQSDFVWLIHTSSSLANRLNSQVRF